jgi:hypothetical protein
VFCFLGIRYFVSYCMHLIIAVLAVSVLSVAAIAQTRSSASPPAGGSESLGNQLLNDLMPSARQKLQAAQADPNSDSKSEVKLRDAASRYDDLGEDIGRPSGPLSLVRVRQGMQRAESLLGEQSASRSAVPLDQAASVQKQVVDQLDQLIAELSKQCQGGNCPPGDQPPSPGQQSQSQSTNSPGAAAQGQTAARDSTDRLNNAGGKSVDKADFEELAKQLWGHLPQRTREQMMQSFSEEFLPKYEREIEEYYRRLSEEQKSVPAHQ